MIGGRFMNGGAFLRTVSYLIEPVMKGYLSSTVTFLEILRCPLEDRFHCMR